MLNKCCHKSKASLAFWVFYFLILSACSVESDKDIEREFGKTSFQIMDKGLDTLFLDKTVDFQYLGSLQLSINDGMEYVSHFNSKTRSIHIYSLESGELINKIRLAREGPNQVIFPIKPTYFVHRLDSIFVDTQFNTYYLVNDQGEVKRKIGKLSSTFSNEDFSIAFGNASFFDGNQIHGNIRLPFYKTPKETLYTRASFKLSETLEITRSVKSETFIEDFEEIITYRHEQEAAGERLVNLPRHFVHYADYLYATTPISDSIRVFKRGEPLEAIYAGVSQFEKATHKEYLNFVRTESRPGEVTYMYEANRKAYYPSTLIDPDGRFIYRIMVQGTHPINNKNGDGRVPMFNGVTLLAIDLSTKEISTFELPYDEVLVERQLFVGRKGVYFKLKFQMNEDLAIFRIFGAQDDKE